MKRIRGLETERAIGMKVDPRTKFYAFKDRNVTLENGDIVLLQIGRPPHLRDEEYDVPLQVFKRAEPEPDEILIQYGDDLYAAKVMARDS